MWMIVQTNREVSFNQIPIIDSICNHKLAHICFKHNTAVCVKKFFCGLLSLSTFLKPDRYILNDLNPSF